MKTPLLLAIFCYLSISSVRAQTALALLADTTCVLHCEYTYAQGQKKRSAYVLPLSDSLYLWMPVRDNKTMGARMDKIEGTVWGCAEKSSWTEAQREALRQGTTTLYLYVPLKWGGYERFTISQWAIWQRTAQGLSWQTAEATEAKQLELISQQQGTCWQQQRYQNRTTKTNSPTATEQWIFVDQLTLLQWTRPSQDLQLDRINGQPWASYLQQRHCPQPTTNRPKKAVRHANPFDVHEAEKIQQQGEVESHKPLPKKPK